VPGWRAGLLGDLTQYQAYALAAGLLVSPVIDGERSASDFVTELLLATNSTCVWSEGLLKFLPYGDTPLSGNGKTFTPNLTPIYALDDDDFIVDGKDEAPLTTEIEDQSDAYNVVQLEYLDRTNQYNMAIALASDAANVAQYGMRRKDPTAIHCICTPSVAAIAAQLHLQRRLYVRAQYRFKLSWAFALLEPGDIVELTDPGLGLAAYAVRITQIDEDEKSGVLELTCEDLLVGVSHAPLYTMQTSQTLQPNKAVDPGGVEANLLLWSQDFTVVACWTKTALTIGAAATTNPVTGATDAQSATPTTASSSHQARTPDVAVFPGANYMLTGYFKPNGYNFAVLRISQGGGTGGNAVSAVFDVSGGLVGATAQAGTGVFVGATIAPAGGGWFRCALSFQTADPTIDISWRPLPTGTLANYAGSGTQAVYAWGMQLAQGADLRPYAATTSAQSVPIIFNPPMALTPGGLQTWAAVAGGPNWGGCNVWVSYDAVNYELVGAATEGPARFGLLTASLPSHADPDTTDTLAVDLSASNGALTSATQATTDAGGTMCLVDGELVGFETAANRYSLSAYLRRGMLGTSIAAHSAGAPFVRLDSAVFAFPYNAQQAGRTASVKFQSFNLWGEAATPLSECVAYTFIPVPATGAPPASSAWKATFTTISSGGALTPVIIITGLSDNPSATGIEFFYRQTGTPQWVSTGLCGPSTTQKIITGVQSSQTYDVAVAYLVNGVLTPLQTLTGTGGGTTGGGGAGIGTAVINDSRPGANHFKIPAGSTYTHVDIVLTGYAGAGNGSGSGKGGFTDHGGGGANVVVVLGFPVTANVTDISYSLATTAGANSTATYSTTLSLTAHGGADATSSTAGAGGANTGTQTATGSSSVNSYAGRSGGLTDTWDGGGPGAIIDIPSGNLSTGAAVPDNTTDFSAGAIPGQGGAGMSGSPNAGGGANILIIARA
jgi:hypothetical protein